MGRPARGVRAINLADEDYLVGMEIVSEQGLILSISELGYGKRTPLQKYRLTARGAKGVINMKSTRRTGKVVAVMAVKEDSDLMIITKEGKIIRIESSQIRQAGRSTQGVRLVRMEDPDQVAAACIIPEEAAPPNGNGESVQENLPL
jgi:DNA gyrase subunit A